MLTKADLMPDMTLHQAQRRTMQMAAELMESADGC